MTKHIITSAPEADLFDDSGDLPEDFAADHDAERIAQLRDVQNNEDEDDLDGGEYGYSSGHRGEDFHSDI